MDELLVQATGIKKSFHSRRDGASIPAVDEVDLSIRTGEIYGLVGSDGAGKTTTMRLLVGALKLDAGEISVAGYDIRKKVELARAQIGYLSQRFSLYEDLTVLENIRFFAEVRGLPSSEWQPRCLQILEFVGLIEFKDRRAGQLSGGMKQKLGLASALVTRPRVLLLDEPTTGVDPVTRQDFWQLIIQLVSSDNSSGVCVLISTPYMDEAERCQRIGFMRHGKIITEGSAGELRATLNERILELRGAPLTLLRGIAAQDPGVEDVRTFGDRLHMRLKEPLPQVTIDRLQAAIPQGGGQFTDARSIPPGLEDVFIALTHAEE
jgi:drug efflux transport system ATP-binding protein